MRLRLFRRAIVLGSSLTGVFMMSCGSGGDPRNFGLQVSPSVVSVVANYTTPAFNIAVHPLNGFTNEVQVAAEATPGLECVPISCTKSTSQGTSFRFNTFASTTPGNYPVIFHGTGGKYPHDITAYVHVLPSDGTSPPPDFDFEVQPEVSFFSTPPRLYLKGAVQYRFTFYRYNHYTGPITVSGAVSQELTCARSCTTTTYDDTAVLSVDVTAAPPSTYTNVFTATASTVSKTTSARIVITPPTPQPSPGR